MLFYVTHDGAYCFVPLNRVHEIAWGNGGYDIYLREGYGPIAIREFKLFATNETVDADWGTSDA